MLSPIQISRVVYDVLHAMDIHEPSVERLIKSTFLVRSGLTRIFDYSNSMNPLHGLMLLDTKRCVQLYEKLKYNRNLINKVLAATGIDISDMDITFFVKELDTNIAFMVAITYCFYANLHEDFPDDSLDAVAQYYFRYYMNDDEAPNLKHFTDLYRSVF
jgi:hypothetical protein